MKTRKRKTAAAARKSAVVRSPATNGAKNGAGKEPTETQTPVAGLSPADAIKGFEFRAKDWNVSAIALVSSGAVCMIVHAYAEREKDRRSYEDTATALEKITEARGLKRSQMHKYIAFARAFANHLRKEFEIGGPVHDVLACTAHDEAVDVLLAYAKSHKVGCLDDMSVLIGLAVRESGRKRPVSRKPSAKKRRAAAAKKRAGNRKASPAVTAPAPATEPIVVPIATAKNADEARNGLTDMARFLPTQTFVNSGVRAGHMPTEIAFAAINLVDMTADIARLEEALEGRKMVAQGHMPPVHPAQPGTAERSPRLGKARAGAGERQAA